MPTTLLGPGKYKKFLYETTPKKRRVGIQIESSSPINIYVVQASDLQNWREGRDYGGMSFLSRKLLDVQVNIQKDFENEWYLVMENEREKPAAVHYELFDL